MILYECMNDKDCATQKIEYGTLPVLFFFSSFYILLSSFGSHPFKMSPSETILFAKCNTEHDSVATFISVFLCIGLVVSYLPQVSQAFSSYKHVQPTLRTGIAL